MIRESDDSRSEWSSVTYHDRHRIDQFLGLRLNCVRRLTDGSQVSALRFRAWLGLVRSRAGHGTLARRGCGVLAAAPGM
jgi:hypothetical protein